MDASSGASVRRVVTDAGHPAYLKRCSAALGAVELDFYRHVAASLPVRTPALLGYEDDGDTVSLLLEDAGEARPVAAWTDADWAALGRTLARLHGVRDGDRARVHGDCHAGNVLFREGEEPALCDWQSTHLGDPVTDLAFVRVRAAPYGVEAPAAYLAAYLAGSDAEPDALRRAVDLEELRYLVEEWPEYAAWNDDEANERVRRRAARLRSATDAGRA